MLIKLGEGILPIVDRAVSSINLGFDVLSSGISKINDGLDAMGIKGVSISDTFATIFGQGLLGDLEWLGSRVNMKAKPIESVRNESPSPSYQVGAGILQSMQMPVGYNISSNDNLLKQLSKPTVPVPLMSPEQSLAKKAEKGIAIADAVPNEEKKKRGSNSSGIDAVGFSSQRPQSITVTIQNIHVNENPQYNTVTESLGDIGRMVTEVIVNAVRDSELALG